MRKGERALLTTKDKLAIFDLDGTLFDTKDINYCAYKEALEKYGYSLNYTQFCNECNGKYYYDFLPQIVGNCDKELLHVIHKEKKYLYEKYITNAVENTHLLNIIKGIRKTYYIALVTTASKENTYALLKFHGKLEMFDLIITAEDTKNVKPNPEGFLKAMEFFNVCKEDTIIFEDSEVGVIAAKASGAFTYCALGYK